MSRRCIHCQQTGHVLLDCPTFLEDLLKPSPGVCARCGGPGTFFPARSMRSDGADQVEARLVCSCCSYPACQHRCAYVDGDGVQCRGPFGHGHLVHGHPGGGHDCRPGKDDVRVAQYSGRSTPSLRYRRTRKMAT